MIGETDILPEFVCRMLVESVGDEGGLLERARVEVGDNELKEFAGE